MKILIYYDGNVFESEDRKVTAEVAKEWLYDDIEELDKMCFPLSDGGYLILRKESLSRCAFVIKKS